MTRNEILREEGQYTLREIAMTIRVAVVLAAIAAVGVPADAAGNSNTPFQRSVPVIRTPSNIPMLQCRPDPGIVSITLNKLGPTHPGRANEITISYTVRNFGTQWRDTSGKAGMALLTVQDGSGHSNTAQQYFPRDAAPGAIMIASMPYRTFSNFGSDEFVGFVAVSLRYDPDDSSDGNPCNDDNNIANNEFRIGGSNLTSFLFGSVSSKTFTR